MEQFVKMITEELKKQFGEGYEITPMEKRKNNGIVLHGICIHKKGENISPVVYVDTYYKDYEKGILGITQIADSLRKDCTEEKMPEQVPDGITDYGAMKSRIRLAVINYQANTAELEDRPHRRFLDLAVVYYMDMEEVDVRATCSVTNRVMALWGTSEPELFRQGCENQRLHDTACIEGFSDILEEMLQENPDEEMRKTLAALRAGAAQPLMLIASNRKRQYGACCILDTSFLQGVADGMACNLVIYPSSLHEIVIVPKYGEKDVMGSSGVEEINSTTVNAEEQLSNSVYLFDREKGEVSIYKEGAPLKESM